MTKIDIISGFLEPVKQLLLKKCWKKCLRMRKSYW